MESYEHLTESNARSNGKQERTKSAFYEHPNPEVLEKAKRRTFSAEYKLQIVREADACRPGEVGILLRREGLYSSNLSTWRRQRERGELDGLSPKRRGWRSKPVDTIAKRNAELKRENERLQRRLAQAEAIIEVQKKVAALLGNPIEDDGNGS